MRTPTEEKHAWNKGLLHLRNYGEKNFRSPAAPHKFFVIAITCIIS